MVETDVKKKENKDREAIDSVELWERTGKWEKSYCFFW